MSEFVSESIVPHEGTFDTQAMARGEPGLPRGFTWRGVSYVVVEVLARWKRSTREGGRAQGELYLRRHYYKLRMSDEALWTVYFIRQTPRTGPGKRRWFLYAVRTRSVRPSACCSECSRGRRH